MNPFATDTYILGDPDQTTQWDSATLITVTGTTIDCGDIYVTFEQAEVDSDTGIAGPFTSLSNFSVDQITDEF